MDSELAGQIVTDSIEQAVTDSLLSSGDAASGPVMVQRQGAPCVAAQVYTALYHLNFTQYMDMDIGEIVSMRIAPYILMLMALVIASFGHLFLKPSVCMLGFIGGTLASLHVTYTYASFLHDWSCEAIVAASCSAGGVVALGCAILVRTVSVVLGAAAGASLGILVFDLCTICNTPLWGADTPMLFDRTLFPFWVTMFVLVLGGGFLCRKQEKSIIALVTSIVGAWIMALAARLAAGAQGVDMPFWATMAVAGTTGVGGFGIQMYLLRRKERRKRQKEAKSPRGVVTTQGVVLTTAGVA